MNPRNTAIKDLNNHSYQFKRSGGNQTGWEVKSSLSPTKEADL